MIVSNQNGEWRDSFTIELWKREGNLGMHRKGFGFACEGWNMLSATGFFFFGFVFVNIIWGGLTS